MKTIAKYQSPEEARIALSFLQANGIHAFLPGSETLANFPPLAYGVTGYQLMVPEDEYDKALALLQNPPQADKPEDQ